MTKRRDRRVARINTALRRLLNWYRSRGMRGNFERPLRPISDRRRRLNAWALRRGLR